MAVLPRAARKRAKKNHPRSLSRTAIYLEMPMGDRSIGVVDMMLLAPEEK